MPDAVTLAVANKQVRSFEAVAETAGAMISSVIETEEVEVQPFAPVAVTV